MKKKYILSFGLIFLSFLLIQMMYKVYMFSKTYIYPLDDAYIHLSIAKNFAEKQVWGITSYEFSSTTSSPFFTLLLALGIKIIGNQQFLPIVLNVIAGIFLLLVLHRVLKHENYLIYGLILLSTIILMPLHTMILIGMEHVIHTLFLLICIITFNKYIKGEESKYYNITMLFSILSVGFRYESLFFIFFMCVYLFFFKKQYIRGILLGMVSLSPVILYGIISLSHGSYFLPNSLVLKGNLNDGLIGFIHRVMGNLYRALSILPLFLLLIIQLLISFRKVGLKDKLFSSFIIKNSLQLIVFLGITLHILFANFGWLVRYEAYMIPILLVSIIPILNHTLKNKRQILNLASLFIFFGVSFYYRFITMIKYETVASKNIYEQQIQIARFLNKYYNTSKVVLNDIGAVTYFTKIQILDTYGLGSIGVARIRKDDHAKFNNNNQKLIQYISDYTRQNDFDIAVVYDNWIKMPVNFKKIGSWDIQDNYICGNPKVTFYEIKKDSKLLERFIQFKKELPHTVIVEKK